MVKTCPFLFVFLTSMLTSFFSPAQEINDRLLNSELNQAIKEKQFLQAARLGYKLGELYHQRGNKTEAKKILIQSATHARKSNSPADVYLATYRLGNIYLESEEFNSAADYFNKSAKTARELDRFPDALQSYLLEGKCHAQLRRFKRAVEPVELALQLALAKTSVPDQLQCYDLLTEYYLKSGNQRKSIEANNLAMSIRSLQEKEMSVLEKVEKLQEEAVQAIQAKNENENLLVASTEKLKVTEESLKVVEEISEHRKLEIDLLSKDKELAFLRIQEQHARLENEALFRNSILIGFLLASSLVGLTIINYRRKLKTNKKLDLQNKNIKSSINYAKRIQEAMLPKQEIQNSLLKESFILFKPRDTVSGDFYWFSSLKNGNDNDLVFSAIDCTGHGVPGAFMSMIGINSLNSIINRGITSTNTILETLHKEIRTALQQEVTGNNDGMDIALCIYRKEQNMLEFSGAKNPLVYIQDNELFQIKGDIHSIGGSRSKAETVYKKHQIEIDKPTMVYLFTDGFRDQFGGPENQKFMGKRFSRLLLDIHHLPLNEQVRTLEEIFDSWKGTGDQTDDVLVMGIKLGV